MRFTDLLRRCAGAVRRNDNTKCGGNTQDSGETEQRSEYEALKAIVVDKVEPYGYDGAVMLARVCDVYDGDTFHAVVFIGGFARKITVRCAGYDTPEMRPSRQDPHRDAVKKLALLAKSELEAMILGCIVRLRVEKFEKYGRFLATVYEVNADAPHVDGDNVCEKMMKLPYVFAYNGGTKPSSAEFAHIAAEIVVTPNSASGV